MEEVLISGVTLNRDEAKLTMLGVPDRPGDRQFDTGPRGG